MRSNPEFISMIKGQHRVDNNGKWVFRLAIGLVIVGGVSYVLLHSNNYRGQVIARLEENLDKAKEANKSLYASNQELKKENVDLKSQIQNNDINSPEAYSFYRVFYINNSSGTVGTLPKHPIPFLKILHRARTSFTVHARFF